MLIGFVAPALTTELKPLGTAFAALIKMMIPPIVFCTVVLDIGSVATTATVSRVGLFAIGVSAVDFLLGVMPATLLSAFVEGQVLQTLLVALFADSRCGNWGRRASRSSGVSSTSGSGYSASCR